ncbi:C4-dicarboxylate TRAP transporter substrate-binding protein [Rhodoligotrophos defluvii]|uniref:C4-dicarboxylate TRAP transporter substrate-binding protein n=1 Tax=Rhodoligotrophos defluvii TaxID=2561934 RepID=UPI0010C98FAF|nr:C4-dicarboxylate TRAP transporter substrate-binding protein [Rhodoligotrophos defluvii]
MRKLLWATTVALVFGATAGTSIAKDLVLSHGYPTTHPLSVTYERFADYIAKNSDIKLTIHPGGALTSLTETSPAIRDGVVDMGTVNPPYYLAEFPNSNLVANLSMLATAGEAVKAPGPVMVGATMEYIFFNCEDCQRDYEQQGQVYLGSLSTSTFDLLCSKPIRSVADVRGKRLRSGAANFGRWAEHFGGVQVQLPGGEIYESLSQGVVDCTMQSVSDMTGYQLKEVAKFATLGFLGGVFSGIDPHNININTWRSLTDEQRRVLLDASARGVAAATQNFYKVAKDNVDNASELKIEIIPATDEMVAANQKFVEEDMKVIERQFSEEYGVKDTKAKIEKIRALINRWKGLLANWDGKEESLAKLFSDEIFSKIDESTYGMN